METEKEFEKSHSRNSSYASQHSRTGSNYGSLTHSRQSSSGTGNDVTSHLTHTRSVRTLCLLGNFASFVVELIFF